VFFCVYLHIFSALPNFARHDVDLPADLPAGLPAGRRSVWPASLLVPAATQPPPGTAMHSHRLHKSQISHTPFCVSKTKGTFPELCDAIYARAGLFTQYSVPNYHHVGVISRREYPPNQKSNLINRWYGRTENGVNIANSNLNEQHQIKDRDLAGEATL
jgi:hypothetical protein